jgi:hypothetical protein
MALCNFVTGWIGQEKKWDDIWLAGTGLLFAVCLTS